MAEHLLLAYVRDEIPLELITAWLKSPNGSDNNEVFSMFTCCQQDFIEYFINYIHEDGLGDVKTNEAGLLSTPEKHLNNKQTTPAFKKRARLQPVRETGQKSSQSFSFAPVEKSANWLTSTPKAKNRNLNKSLPSWPQKPNSNQKRPQTKDRSLCLGDFVVKATDKLKKRRIKPTAVEDNPTFKPLQTSFENFVNSGNEKQNLDSVTHCLKCNTVDLSDAERKHVMLANRLKSDGNRQDCACVLQNSNKINTSYNEKFEQRFEKRQVETSFVDELVYACNDESTDKFEIHRKRLDLRKPVVSLDKQVCESINVSEGDFRDNNVEMSFNQSPSSFGTLSKSEIIPRFEFCQYFPELDKVINLFLYFLESSLLLSLTSELHFLLTILVSHHYKDPDDDIGFSTLENITSRKDLTTLFISPHNRTYFSLEVLQKTVNFLHIFDISTLELLLNNEHVQNFGSPGCVKFRENLQSIVTYKLTEETEKEEPVAVQNFESTVGTNVNFSTETDNRENFVNDASFHAFKKQRDMFYDFFWTWEQRRSSPDWNFAFALGQKVKSLFYLCDDPVNYRQFARLFVSQMVLVCYTENEGKQYIHNEAAILQKLPGIDSSKLTKLKFRLLVKNDKNGTSTAPNFVGSQEFFKEFIIASSNSVFYEHLKDAIVTELLSQENVEFTGYEFDRRETLVKHQAKASLLVKLKKTRILAKFLGYVESLPYQCDYEKLSKKVLQRHLSARNYYTSCLDLKSIILNATDKRKSIFSVSWIVVYLSMLDYVTLRLPYYKEIYEILFCIYKRSENIIFVQNVTSISHGMLLVRVSLGWLLELQYFPSSLYYKWLDEQLICNNFNDKFEYLWTLRDSDDYFSEKARGNIAGEFPIDCLDIVDGATVYACCPSLEKFKTLLSTGQNKYVGEVKRLPLSNVDKVAMSQEHVERRLEEAFLTSRTQAFRKSIEFVTERVYAGCVQYLSNHVLPVLKKDLAAAFEQSIKSPRLTPEDRNQLEAKHLKEIEDGLPDITKDMRRRCLEIAERIVPDRVEKATFGLLQPDELLLTVKTAGAIAVRMCLRQIRAWMDDALSSATVEKMVVHELRKVLHSKPTKVSSVLPCNGKPILHDDNTLSAIEASQNLRNLMITSLEKKLVTEDCIQSKLEDCKLTISKRCDVNDNITLCIHKQTIDFFLILVSFQIELSERVLPLFIQYWFDIRETKIEMFNLIICPRNIQMLSQSSDLDKSWKIFEKFLLTLHRNKLLSTAVLEEQCLRIYKHDWDSETLQRISSCYQSLINNIKEPRETFDGLVTFMSNFTIDLDTY